MTKDDPPSPPLIADDKAAAPEPWWKVLLGFGILGMFAAGFHFFPTVTMGALFSFFGLLIVGGTVYLYASALQLVRHGVYTDGVVVGFEERLEDQEEGERKYSIQIGPISWSFGPKEERRVSFFPRVEFETKNHEKRVFMDDEGARKASYRVGEVVRVLYDPARPQIARINKPLWWPFLGAVAFGACFLVPGLWFLLMGLHVLPGEIHWE